MERLNWAGTGQARSRLMRRLRMVSQAISGRPRVTVRANYVGLPSMAGRGTDNAAKAAGLQSLSSPRKCGSEAVNVASGAPDGAAS